MHETSIYQNNLLKNFWGVTAVDGMCLLIEKGETLGIQEMDAVRSCMGMAFQDAVLDSKLAGSENQDFNVQLHSMDRDVRGKRMDKVLHLVDISESEAFDDPISKWRQRRKRS